MENKTFEKERLQSKTTISCKTEEAYLLTIGYLKKNHINYVEGKLKCDNGIVTELVFFENVDGMHNNNLNDMFKELGI